MCEAPGMRCTRDSYLVFKAWLSSCRDLVDCEVYPKPAYIRGGSAHCWTSWQLLAAYGHSLAAVGGGGEPEDALPLGETSVEA